MEPLDDRGRIVARLLADRFDLLGLLGKGGFAAVYQVRSHTLKRLEALKVLHERHDEGSDFATRFIQEARVAASLEHPNIVKIHDFGHAEGMFWFSMQLIQGPTLKMRLKELGTLEEETAARIGAALADALDYSHARGVIHRDIKPANVILDAGGRPYLMDFGIAKVGDNLIKTQTGFILGSPPYLSPEQIRGQPLDGRCDLYSLGTMLYQALSGAVPFRSDDAVQALARRLTEDARPLSERRPEIHPDLERIVMRALERNREERFPSAAEMRDDLEDFLSAVYPRSTTQVRVRRSGAEIPAAPSDEERTFRMAAITPSPTVKPAVPGTGGSAAATPAPPAVVPAPRQPAALPAPGLRPARRVHWPYLLAGGVVVVVLAVLLAPRAGRRTEPPASIPGVRAISSIPDVPAISPLPTPASTEPTPVPSPPEAATPSAVEATPTPRNVVSPVASRPARSPVPPDSGPVPRRIKYPADVLADVPIALPSDLAGSCAGRTVGLHLVIGENGSLRSAKVISSSTVSGCDAAALEAIRRYQFKPALDTEEKPIEGRLLISVHF